MYQIDFKHPVHVYFIGIGGISMSGLAEILLSEGFRVSGSDRQKSPLTAELEAKNATIYYGQTCSHITSDVDLVVYTSAIKDTNPEMIGARALQIPMLSRAELLGQLMKNYKLPIAISGTHGKTTTTSMLSEVLLAEDTDPTLSIGGILPSIGGNYRVGNDNYFVTEACEYTDSFLHFFPKISIILNIEADHLDYFKDLTHIRDSFRKFAALLPQEGILLINSDIDNYGDITEGLNCKVITFGSEEDADYSFADLSFDEMARPTFTLVRNGRKTDRKYSLGVTGKHNVINALSVIAMSELLGLSEEKTAASLQKFTGTERRFEYKGDYHGVTVIDDYAHHPTEIRATLTAARNYPHNTIWCVFQPHTYTRTYAFMDDFAKALGLADRVVLADIYAARETDTLGISSETLQERIKALGTVCDYFPSFEEIQEFLKKNCTKGDLLITMGAGDVVKIGENLLLE